MVDLTLPGGSTQLQMIYFKVPNFPKLCGRMWLIGRLFIPSVSPKKSPAVQKKTGNHPRTLKLAGLNPYQHPMSEGSTSSASRTSMCNTPWYWGTAPFLLELHNTVGTTNTAKLGLKKKRYLWITSNLRGNSTGWDGEVNQQPGSASQSQVWSRNIVRVAKSRSLNLNL